MYWIYFCVNCGVHSISSCILRCAHVNKFANGNKSTKTNTQTHTPKKKPAHGTQITHFGVHPRCHCWTYISNKIYHLNNNQPLRRNRRRRRNSSSWTKKKSIIVNDSFTFSDDRDYVKPTSMRSYLLCCCCYCYSGAHTDSISLYKYIFGWNLELYYNNCNVILMFYANDKFISICFLCMNDGEKKVDFSKNVNCDI